MIFLYNRLVYIEIKKEKEDKESFLGQSPYPLIFYFLFNRLVKNGFKRKESKHNVYKANKIPKNKVQRHKNQGTHLRKSLTNPQILSMKKNCPQYTI